MKLFHNSVIFIPLIFALSNPIFCKSVYTDAKLSTDKSSNEEDSTIKVYGSHEDKISINSMESSATETMEESSDRLCAKDSHGYPLRKYQEIYDNKTQKCYPKGYPGPCGDYMTFEQAEDDSEYGSCTCAFMKNHCDGKLPTEIQGPIIRAKKDQLCYPLYKKGPCKSEEILTLSKEGQGICVDNCKDVPKLNFTKVEEKVANDKAKPSILFWLEAKWDLLHQFYIYKENCYQTLTQGHCTKATDIAVFDGSNPVPKCIDGYKDLQNVVICSLSASVSTATLKCNPPTIRSGSDCVHPNFVLNEEE